MTAVEFCDISSANRDDRFVIEKFYKKENWTLEEWYEKTLGKFISIKKINIFTNPELSFSQVKEEEEEEKEENY